MRGEFELARHLLNQPTVLALLGAQRVDVPELMSRVEAGSASLNRESCERACAVVQQPHAAHDDRSIDLLLKLLSLGTDALRAAFTTSRLKPGDIPFVLAHGQAESLLRQAWPSAVASRSVEIVNDNYSPMECVYPALEAAFGMTPEAATETMLRIHHAGVLRVQLHGHSDLVNFCTCTNATWRNAGLALYCRPSTEPPT